MYQVTQLAAGQHRQRLAHAEAQRRAARQTQQLPAQLHAQITTDQ